MQKAGNNLSAKQYYSDIWTTSFHTAHCSGNTFIFKFVLGTGVSLSNCTVKEDWKVLFGVHWHFSGILHVTWRRSLLHWCDARPLLRNGISTKGRNPCITVAKSATDRQTQTYMGGPIRCFFFTLEREGHLTYIFGLLSCSRLFLYCWHSEFRNFNIFQ
jgi:hypothetical protein